MRTETPCSREVCRRPLSAPSIFTFPHLSCPFLSPFLLSFPLLFSFLIFLVFSPPPPYLSFPVLSFLLSFFPFLSFFSLIILLVFFPPPLSLSLLSSSLIRYLCQPLPCLPFHFFPIFSFSYSSCSHLHLSSPYLPFPFPFLSFPPPPISTPQCLSPLLLFSFLPPLFSFLSFPLLSCSIASRLVFLLFLSSGLCSCYLCLVFLLFSRPWPPVSACLFTSPCVSFLFLSL